MDQQTDLQTSEVAVLCDPENILRLHVRIAEFPERLFRFLKELQQLFRRFDITPSRQYSRCYVERQHDRSNDWHRQCEAAAIVSGFTVRWSEPTVPAELLLAYEVQQMIHKGDFPREIYVVSSDGDTIPAIDELRHVAGRRVVCSMVRKRNENRWLQVVANGVIRLDDEMAAFFNRELI